MPGKRSFIDSRPKLFIALKQIDMDTFYRHLFIIAERRYPVTLYEQLVIELTNRSFSLHAAYRSGSTPYELSDREPEPYDQQIEDFARMIEEADCVLVGGASGLSAAGGGDFYYEDNATYRKHFGKFAERYGFKGAFEGSFYRWPTAEARWGYLATFLDTTLNAPLRKPYRDLDAILAEKDFFVLTTNQDTQFMKIYPWEKVAEIQGDHRFFQCSRCCTDEVWDAIEPVSRMVEAMGDGLEVPTELVPRCPHCGAEAFPWVRGYGNFLQGELYEEQYRKVSDWLDAHARQRILFLELGVGRMTPAFIQEPFWALTAQLPQAGYIAVNNKTQFLPRAIEDRGLAVRADIADQDAGEVAHGDDEGGSHRPGACRGGSCHHRRQQRARHGRRTQSFLRRHPFPGGVRRSRPDRRHRLHTAGACLPGCQRATPMGRAVSSKGISRI